MDKSVEALPLYEDLSHCRVFGSGEIKKKINHIADFCDTECHLTHMRKSHSLPCGNLIACIGLVAF